MGYLRTLEQRVAELERENSSLRNALQNIEGMLIITVTCIFSHASNMKLYDSNIG